MTRLLVYVFLFGMVMYLLSLWSQKQESPSLQGQGATKPKRWFRSKRDPMEIWTQVYETASADEGRLLLARLQEEEVECVLYEQGKRDIHGNPLIGIGIAVPKTSVGHAQRIISNMPT